MPSAVTVWDKQFVLIDEINRAVPELQAKWLEIIRSRKIMGFETEGEVGLERHEPNGRGRYKRNTADGRRADRALCHVPLSARSAGYE